MWTNENRARYDRSKLRYPSDLADTEWAIIAPLIPPAKRCGNKRTVVEREIVNGLMDILSTGCQWASLPKDLPPRSTVNDYFCRWNSDGTLDRIHHALYVRCRELAEREASPTAAIDGGEEATGDKADAQHLASLIRRGLVTCCSTSSSHSRPPTGTPSTWPTSAPPWCVTGVCGLGALRRRRHRNGPPRPCRRLGRELAQIQTERSDQGPV